jgi:hypothetical protein
MLKLQPSWAFYAGANGQGGQALASDASLSRVKARPEQPSLARIEHDHAKYVPKSGQP